MTAGDRMCRKLILFLDCGDTIIDEATQVRDARDIVTEAAPIPGMVGAVKALHGNGFRLALVADGETDFTVHTAEELLELIRRLASAL